MLNIYITRHGQNQDNADGILNGHRDEPLTERGILQAEEIATAVRESGIVFQAVYASPLRRAFKTAEIISEKAMTPLPKKEPLLIERDFGVMTGKNIADIEKICAPRIIKGEHITYFLDPPGAETFPDLLKRAGRLRGKIESVWTSGNILLVTHGDIGKMIYADYYGLDWKQVLTQFHFGNCDLLLLSKKSAPEETHVFRFKQLNK